MTKIIVAAQIYLFPPFSLYMTVSSWYDMYLKLYIFIEDRSSFLLVVQVLRNQSHRKQNMQSRITRVRDNKWANTPLRNVCIYRQGKMVRIINKRMLIWMDDTSEGGDKTKEVVLADNPNFSSNELQLIWLQNQPGGFLMSVISLTNHMQSRHILIVWCLALKMPLYWNQMFEGYQREALQWSESVKQTPGSGSCHQTGRGDTE